MTAGLEFERKVSIGNLLSIATIATAVIFGYAMLSGRVDSNTQTNTLLDRRLTVQETQLEVLKDSVTEDRLNTTRVLTELQADVKYMRSSLDELKQQAKRL